MSNFHNSKLNKDKNNLECSEVTSYLCKIPNFISRPLTPDTEPKAIIRVHKKLVEEAVEGRVRVEPAVVSEQVCLPEWNVCRILKSLGWTRKKEDGPFTLKDVKRTKNEYRTRKPVSATVRRLLNEGDTGTKRKSGGAVGLKTQVDKRNNNLFKNRRASVS